MSSSFLRLHHAPDVTVIEVFPDEYIKWQPLVREDIPKKIETLKKLPLRKKFVVVIECDRALFFDRINFVLLSEMAKHATTAIPVILKHCGPHLRRIVESVSFPREKISVYFNDILR